MFDYCNSISLFSYLGQWTNLIILPFFTRSVLVIAFQELCPTLMKTLDSITVIILSITY